LQQALASALRRLAQLAHTSSWDQWASQRLTPTQRKILELLASRRVAARPPLVVRIWRELMADSLSLQGPFQVAVWGGRDPVPEESERLRAALGDVADGAHSVAELDIKRMCRRCGLSRPVRQVRRRDAGGRLRFTDCEWRLPDGRTLILEIDGGFHMDVAHWEDDLARQRALSGGDRVIVRCTARELRDEPELVARDLHERGCRIQACHAGADVERARSP